MRPNNIELTYQSYLSKDYELLYDLVKDISVQNKIICFIDSYYKATPYRHQIEAQSPIMFTSVLLDESPFKSREEYIDFCKKHNLTFIKP